MNKGNDLKIKNFKDIHEQHHISFDTLDGIVKRMARSMGIRELDKVVFTSLQREAFNTDGFWLADKNPRHMILQGATSAGKTLVSEMAMLDTLKNGNKTIVLVPLRAMVRERWEHWKNDLENQGDSDRVYASSADYQEHDGEIINGDYDVAVIVYEKFFVMLAQSKGKMLAECALLIVDELQMLNNQNRGPKLEIAVQKVLRKNAQGGVNTRIMCLTTCDCKVDYVTKWLTVSNNLQNSLSGEPILIRNTKRPTALDEYVIQLDGHYRMQHTGGENVNVISESEFEEGVIEVPNFNKKAKSNEKKKALLKILLQKIYAENPNVKVLVFVKSRRNTIELAQYIADENILPKNKLSNNLSRIDYYDNDEDQQKLKGLLYSRIACHNAAMTTSLREFVEEMFEDEEDPIKLVVATETLTVGMNMPVDVMILYDHEVPRGRNMQKKEELLTSQEYKNYIGRAGRLGGQNSQIGRSYLFVEDSRELKKLWNDYVDCSIKDIESSLKGADEKEQAPYYLSLFDESGQSEGYKLSNLNELWEESFSKSCGGRKIEMSKLFAELKKAGLCFEDDDDDDEEEQFYKSTDFGKMMTPYAFTLNTCKKIDRFLFHGGRRSKKGFWQKDVDKGKGGLPTEISSEVINKYVLDILYVICCTDEVKAVGQIKMPPDTNDRARKAKEIVEKTLKQTIEQVALWDESPLKYMADESYNWQEESATKECIMRAIILWCWTQGMTIDEIRNKTNFQKFTTLVAGDIARLAETAAYVLESFSHCLPGYKGGLKFVNVESENLQSDIYKLSTRVNYGVSQGLVKVANKHVHGLDRKVILELGKFYQSVEHMYDDIFHMLRDILPEHKKNLEDIIRDEQRKELLKNVEESHTHETLDSLFDNIHRETELDNDACDMLKNFCETDLNNSTKALLKPLSEIFKDYNDAVEDNSKKFFFNDAIKIDYLDPNENFIKLICVKKNSPNEKKTVFVIAYTPEVSEVASSYKFHIDKSKNNNSVTILLINNNDKINKFKKCDDGTTMLLDVKGDVILERIHSVMSYGNFGGLIAQAIMDGNKSASKLIDFLFDWRGEFYKPVKSFPLILKNYEKDGSENFNQNSLQPIRVLWDNFIFKYAISDLKNELERYNIPYRELAWGENLREERNSHNDECTLLMLNWETVRSSESLSYFCEGLRKIQFKNVFAVFHSEELFNAWGGEPGNPYKILHHIESTKNFSNDILKIINFFDYVQNKKFRVGISYAHENEMDAKRPAVEFLEKFVKQIQSEIPAETILFDQLHQHLFSGNGARKAVLDKYSQCDYFIILDDQYYDQSEFCKEECETIKKTLSEKKYSRQHICFLHPKNEKHCSLFNPEEDFSSDFSNIREADELAKNFLKALPQSIFTGVS